MNLCQGFAKTWINEVVEKKEQAYHDLITSLIDLVKEQNKIKDLKVGIDDLDEEGIKTVLESIPDMSRKYIDSIGCAQVEIWKEEEEITRKRFTEQKKVTEQHKVLDEYYEAAKDLCKSQKIFMAKLENLSKVLDNPKRLLALINHVQLPAVQVTMTTKEQDKKLARLTGKEILIAQHLPNNEGWRLAISSE